MNWSEFSLDMKAEFLTWFGAITVPFMFQWPLAKLPRGAP